MSKTVRLGFTMIAMLFATTMSYSQCINYTTKKGGSCGNPESLDVKITNNCSSTQYVMALYIGENMEVKKLMGLEIKPGDKRSSFACHGTNLTVRYWDVDPNDPYAASRAARAWYNKCRENNYIR